MKPVHASLVALAVLCACDGDSLDGVPEALQHEAEIIRTAYGLPHVSATSEAGLGFGVGYAQAQDAVCELAEQFVTVAGERARFFGAGEPGAATGGLPANLASDYYYRLLNEDEALRAAASAQSPQALALLRGWAAGYNHLLRERSALPVACRDAAWLRPLDEVDLLRLMRFYSVIGGLYDLQGMVAAAQPLSAGQPASSFAPALARPTASNALAIGRDASQNGRGLLLGNPHFPWHGPLRMQMLHVRLPGRINAMGATLPGVPVVGIGFTANFAWSHTTAASAPGTYYRLQLDPKDETRYIVDGSSRAMQVLRIEVPVRQADGSLRNEVKRFYRCDFGWLLSWQGDGTAMAYRDARLDSHRLVDEWYGINRAGSLAELKAAVQRNIGNPWNNTIAADREGGTLWLGVTPVPKLSDGRLQRCQAEGFEAHAAHGLFVLEARDDCRWESDPSAPRPGIHAGRDLPLLERSDFVHNANDSAWLANPAAPLRGYSPLVSRADLPLPPRARYGLNVVTDGLRGGARLGAEQIKQMVMGNRVYLADLLVDDLLQACSGWAEQAESCAALAAWNRRADLDAGIGFAYFESFVKGLEDVFARQSGDALPDAWWRRPFDVAAPLSTPAGLRVDDAQVLAGVRERWRAAVERVDASGLWRGGRRWGDVQRASLGGSSLGVHGGSGALGVYNAMEAVLAPGATALEVEAGTSYLQVVSFDALGPQAQALLAYSQSPDPHSPHAADQTQMYARKQWISLPFSDQQIAADPAQRRLRIRRCGSDAGAVGC